MHHLLLAMITQLELELLQLLVLVPLTRLLPCCLLLAQAQQVVLPSRWHHRG